MTSKEDSPITNLPAEKPKIVEPNVKRHGGGYGAHPPEIKLKAVLLIAQKGTAVAAAETGVALRTIQEWALEAKDEITMIRAAEFTEEIDQKIRDILAEIKPDKIKSANFRDLLVGLGIALDKRQQLLGPQKSGGPPSRLRIAWKDGSGAVEIEN